MKLHRASPLIGKSVTKREKMLSVADVETITLAACYSPDHCRKDFRLPVAISPTAVEHRNSYYMATGEQRTQLNYSSYRLLKYEAAAPFRQIA